METTKEFKIRAKFRGQSILGPRIFHVSLPYLKTFYLATVSPSTSLIFAYDFIAIKCGIAVIYSTISWISCGQL